MLQASRPRPGHSGWGRARGSSPCAAVRIAATGSSSGRSSGVTSFITSCRTRAIPGSCWWRQRPGTWVRPYSFRATAGAHGRKRVNRPRSAGAAKARHPGRAMSRTESAACILCSRNCGLQVEIEGRSFTRIRGDDAHPNSPGYLCQKAARLERHQNHADTLRHPLKRMPDGRFEPIGWDQALQEIAARLATVHDQHGGRAFAFVGGAGQGITSVAPAAGKCWLRCAAGSPTTRWGRRRRATSG